MDLRRYCVSGGSAAFLRAQRTAEADAEDKCRAERAMALGLAWPRVQVKAGPGKPSREAKYLDALCQYVVGTGPLEHVSRVCPRWWRPGDPIVPTLDTTLAEMVATEALKQDEVLKEDTPPADEAGDADTPKPKRGKCILSRWS